MWTHSHFLVTALVANRLRRRVAVRLWPLLAGAVMPDVPLVVLTLGYAAIRRLTGSTHPGEGLYAPGFDDLFFHNPVWVALHNGLHAPLVLLAVAAAGWFAWRRQHEWGAALCWFALGCGFHALLDVVTHHHDGPLILFPLDWQYRYQSALSYWHPSYYGRLATAAESLLDAGILFYFTMVWIRRARPSGIRPAGAAQEGSVEFKSRRT